jgi:MinD superfamily P-loop ATPase
MNHIRKIAVASGKGGAGKTSLAAALAVCSPEKWALADCDVDAANLGILLKPEVEQEEPFFSGKTAVIDKSKCIRCGKCIEGCRFQSIQNFQVQEIFCEGCGVCSDVCPAGAVELKENKTGMVFKSKVRGVMPMVHADLFPGEDNSGKLVTRVRQKAEEIASGTGKTLLIDGPPGIGCPVIASLTGVDLLLMVVEASLSGFEDAKRLLELTESLNVPVKAVLNKTELNRETERKALTFLKEKGIPVLEMIPFDEEMVRLLEEEKSWMEGSVWIQNKIKNIVEKI